MFSKIKLTGGILALCIFIITLAVAITIWMVPLFIFNVYFFNLDELVQLTPTTIIDNYLILLKYLHLPWISELQMPDFPVSISGALHFYEVKLLFMLNYFLLIISGLISVIFIRQLRKNKQEWKLIAPFQVLNWVPIIAIISLMLNFNQLFILFHEALFNNDAWLFDPATDPIILVLPEQFFLQCFVLVFILIQFGLFLCLRQAKRRFK